VSVEPETTVRELVRLLARERIGGVPVLGEQGEMVGIVTATDLVRLAAEASEGPLDDLLSRLSVGSEEGGEDLLSFLATDAWGDAESLAPVDRPSPDDNGTAYEEYRVRDLMRPASYAVSPDITLEELARILLKARIHRAPVVEDGRLVGIVTTFDVIRVVAGSLSTAEE
jgi:CBS domain-containing protein